MPSDSRPRSSAPTRAWCWTSGATRWPGRREGTRSPTRRVPPFGEATGGVFDPVETATDGPKGCALTPAGGDWTAQATKPVGSPWRSSTKPLAALPGAPRRSSDRRRRTETQEHPNFPVAYGVPKALSASRKSPRTSSKGPSPSSTATIATREAPLPGFEGGDEHPLHPRGRGRSSSMSAPRVPCSP